MDAVIIYDPDNERYMVYEKGTDDVLAQVYKTCFTDRYIWCLYTPLIDTAHPQFSEYKYSNPENAVAVMMSVLHAKGVHIIEQVNTPPAIQKLRVAS